MNCPIKTFIHFQLDIPVFIPTIALIELFELGFLCAMGSLVDYCVSEFLYLSRYSMFLSIFFVQNERIFAELLNFKWYLLPSMEQKTYLLMVNASNKARNIRVANVATLNVNIYLIVCVLCNIQLFYHI